MTRPKRSRVSVPVRVEYDEASGKTRLRTGGRPALQGTRLDERSVIVEASERLVTHGPAREGLRVVYEPEVPREVAVTVSRYLPAVLEFIPTDYHRLLVAWDGENTEAAASMTCRHSYRECVLTVCPRWLAQDEARRRHVLVHEVAHTIVSPIAMVAQRLIDIVAPSENTDGGPWTNAAGDADESVTEDVARHLMRLISESAWPSATSAAQAR